MEEFLWARIFWVLGAGKKFLEILLFSSW